MSSQLCHKKFTMMCVKSMMMVVEMMTRLVVRPLSYCYSSCPPFTAHLPHLSGSIKEIFSETYIITNTKFIIIKR